MTASQLDIYLELRFLVAYLGERAQHGWWASGFFEPTALQFLAPVFTRTARLAQYNGVVAAARRTHDANIGIGRVFHLFRVPTELEQDLHRRAARVSEGAAVLASLSGREAAAQRLLALASGAAVDSEGPVAVGSITDLRKPAAVKQLAGRYVWAFAENRRVYPYFTS